jgi:probable lipoprotein NlpC
MKKLNRFIILFSILFLAESCKVFRKQPHQSQQEDQISRMISIARTYTGVPYLSGGTSYQGVDCSGLLWSVFKQIGLNIPRVAWQQAEFFQEVKLENVQAGDMVFFITSNKGQASTISHSGMITEVRSDKEIIFIHASSSKGVREDNIFNNYWKASFAKAIRPFYSK